ncbi:MAG: GNAT family N-acetyltransferase [Anaerolineae bacterium]
MRVTTYTDPVAFHAATHAWLEADESTNILLLGVCGQLLQQPGRYPLPPHLFSVSDADGLRQVALVTPPNRMLSSLTRGDPVESAAALVAALREADITIPGVTGPNEASAAIASAWTQTTGQLCTPHTHLRAYELRVVNPLPPITGLLRPVNRADSDLVEQWHYDFSMEALGQANRADIQRSISRRVDDGSLFLWEDGQPVCMAGCTRPLVHGISVGPVYTPPEFRRRGYATACVAALSSQLLAQGWHYCGLFANLANPTANAIYQRIGYQPVTDYTEYDFA